MKKIALIAAAITFLFQLSTFHSACAQAPQGFTYQAAVRDAQGHAVAGRQVTVRIALVQGTALGTESYVELHQPTTDAAGLFTITVGQGNALINCTMEACVDWAAGPWFLRSQVDPDGGENFILSTTQQLMSVPYALYAANVQHDSVVVHIVDSVIVHVRDSVIYDTVDTYSYDSHPADVVGSLPGVFSISPANRICFSKGNLQYRASTDTWRFAEHQWDMVGTANANISADDTLWIDLFGFGTSGYNQKYPYMSSTSQSVYPTTAINTTNYDWGVNNAISNGGDSAGLWRTLTGNEWYYILVERPNASSLRAHATVAGIPGIILLPDNWTPIPGIGIDYTLTAFSANVYTVAQWNTLQDSGAVFLPAAGRREGVNVTEVGSKCRYWSSYYGYSSGAYHFYCESTASSSSTGFYFGYEWNYYGCSVRLARDLTVLP